MEKTFRPSCRIFNSWKSSENFELCYEYVRSWSTVHFFDETSGVKTTPNRSYGHSKKGLPAVEIQRYASNCNYTVNLLHSRFGIDNFNILEGPSNGFEMIHFFEESLQAVDHVGNPVLANGDVIVMANCGFHHGVFEENQLHETASWNLSSQLARSKLPIKIPTLRENIAKWRANEQPVSL